MGLPWYGRDYPCVHPTNLTVCPIIHVLWRGCNCTTAGGACTDVGIQRVYQQIRNGSTVTGELWDDATGSAFYDYLVDGSLFVSGCVCAARGGSGAGVCVIQT